ncbi:MAG: S8 family serine peptidase, partial [Ignavibacteria bacterium]
MKKIFLLFLSLFFSINAFSQSAEVTDRLQRRMQSLNPIEYTRVLVFLRNRIDIEALDTYLYKINAPIEYRAQTVIGTLKQKALETQGPLIQYLNSEKSEGKVKQYMNFWITNLFFVEATSDVLSELVRRGDVELIDLDVPIEMDKPIYDVPIPANNSTESVEAGLKVIKADLLWRLGITGVGRTVMHIDTGVDGLHPALAPRWWGNNGRPWYHAWYDPVAPFTTTPTDCGSHGTHTMGIMCGRNSASGDTVGVAPDAYWMSAGITDCPGASYPSMNIAAFQWAMDPDSNTVTMDMPDAISCSWQDPNVPGVGQCTSIYVSTLNAVEAAGIAVVFSAGNSGPGASTITPPKNINTDSVSIFCVGAVDGNTVGTPIASFSSRGPSICGGSGTLSIKPEVSAPGVNVRSLVPGNSYGLNSGTSMAAPHVAGCIALLKQVAPGLTGKQIKAVLFSTCTDLGAAGEDNTYGKGLVDVYAAFQQLGVFPLNAFNLQTPSSGSKIVSFPNSTTPVTLTWDTSATGAQYKWIFGSPTTSPRKITVPSSSNSLTLTLGQLDNLLANAGVAQGDSLVGQWDVWAFRVSPVDSMKSTNGPRSLTLRRGVPSLTTFNLISPPSGTTIVTSAFNSSNVNINWSKSGEGVSYKWKFGSPTLTNIRLSLPSNNSGYDTSLTIANNSLDGILSGLGLSPGDSLVGQYSVWAYNASDSLKATQTYALTLKRQSKGDVVILYDSSSTACRTSRDSVINTLNSLGTTYDLFNRRGNTTGTTSISLRGYKKAIVLGEGTSVMSNVVKDSIKSYLNAGTPAVKSKLIIIAEDVGYHIDRAASTYYDPAFARDVLGFEFVADRPGTIGTRGLIGVTINQNMADSCAGPWPDVLKKSATVPAAQSYGLYKFR